MSRDQLYLLPPGFTDGGERQYCPECAEIWGVLAYYPALKETLEIIYQPLSHPRQDLVSQLGDGRWNCPTLILHPDSPAGSDVKDAGGKRYLDSARAIGHYWAELHGTAQPR